MKGKFYESEYEKALIDLLQAEGWQYTNGGNIHRQLREPLLVEDLNVNDLHIYLQNRYPNLTLYGGMSNLCRYILELRIWNKELSPAEVKCVCRHRLGKSLV